ncbi:ubiquinol-cytochrome C reductase iron-sulfur subunit domain protein [Mycobacterium xenopi 3993]|nr:ubiquinol-cytochrome C reductase iron-sulfur subunit domain protein [Mycobacterium xenopi 3993]
MDWGAIMTDIGDQPAPTRTGTKSPTRRLWRRCRAKNSSRWAAGWTAWKPFTSNHAGRCRAPGPKNARNAKWHCGFWRAVSSAWRCCWCFVLAWEYKPKEASGSFLYSLTTPLYGLTFGLSIMSIAVGAVLFQKKFIPEEISIQERHDNRSPEIHRKTVAANLTDALESSTLRRRKMIGLSLGIGLGAFGWARWWRLSAVSSKTRGNRWCRPRKQEGGAVDVGLDSRYPGETIYLARATGRHGGPRLSRCARKTLTPAAWKRSFRAGIRR